MGLAVLAGGLAFVGTAEATELILDGSFENTKPSNNPIVRVGGKAGAGLGQGWSTFSTYLYSTQYTMPGPVGSGDAYLRPYPAGVQGIAQSSDHVTQLVSLTTGTTLTAATIDSGKGAFTFSAWLSSYLTQGDFSDLTLQFLDASTNAVGSSVAIGGEAFVDAIPTEANSKYSNAKDWAKDSNAGTIPAGARLALVSIQSTSRAGSPDGYVDLVSLDVVDEALTIPSVEAASPGNNAVGVFPPVNISVTLEDRVTAVDTNSVRLYFDGGLVAPSVQKNDTNTLVQYLAGVLPALSSHTYRIVFGDTGTPSTVQTNDFHFTVADYLTLPAALGSPLGSENTNQSGFNVRVYQLDALAGLDPSTVQINLPDSIAFDESVLAGLVGPNVADLSAATSSNLFVTPGPVNWVNSTGAAANFPIAGSFPGIPGTSGTEDNFVDEIVTYVRFPAAGFYQMGINNANAFRLTAATAGVQTLKMTSPTNLVIPCVPTATNINQLQFGGSVPLTPLTGSVVYATPSGNPDDSCAIGSMPNLAGKIVLLDRGGSACSSAEKAAQAQAAGAIAVIEITTGDAGFPFRLTSANTNTPVTIPVLTIGDAFGGSVLKGYLTNSTPVSVTILGDTNPRLAEWDGPKGFGAVDVTFGFEAPAAGVYPFRLVADHTTGAADLEWFTIKLDGTRILLNDTTNPDALQSFSARTAVTVTKFNTPVLSGGNVTLSWLGTGTLEEAFLLTGPWTPSSNQGNPQSIPANGPQKFYRISVP
jgi:hypothetical protein